MYVAVVPNRSSRPAILLRESYRDGDKVKNRTLANLSDWPAERIETLRAALRGDKLVAAAEGLEIVRALPHGHVAAALGTARRIGLDQLADERRSSAPCSGGTADGTLGVDFARGEDRHGRVTANHTK